MPSPLFAATRRKRVGKAQLDECLSRDTQSPRFPVDLGEQVHREVDIDATGLSAGPP